MDDVFSLVLLDDSYISVAMQKKKRRMKNVKEEERRVSFLLLHTFYLSVVQQIRIVFFFHLHRIYDGTSETF